jgi:hypothetical protein
MIFHHQNRSCHPERSEGPLSIAERTTVLYEGVFDVILSAGAEALSEAKGKDLSRWADPERSEG